jgi:hypothetical protein
MWACLASVTALLATAAAGQLCVGEWLLRFKPADAPEGVPSYLTAEFQPVNYTPGRALPPVIIQMLVRNGVSLPWYTDKSLDGMTVNAVIDPPLRVGGNAVEVNNGEVIFEALTVQEAPPVPSISHTLSFAISAGGTTRTLRAGRLLPYAVTEESTPSRLRFSNAGFFTRSGQVRDIPVAPVALPPFTVKVVNLFGFDMSDVDTIIEASATGGTIAPTSFRLRDPDVQLLVRPLTNASRPVLTFTIRLVLPTGPWSSSVSTGPLTPVTAPLRNRFMLFDRASSSITMENQGGTAVLGVPLRPVVINLYTSAMELDTSNTGLIITATTPQGTLSGAEALVVRGVAQFAELTFVGVAPRSAVITFTAGTQGATAVARATLLSGAMVVSVTAVKAQYLSFARASQIQTTAIKLAETNEEFTITSIIIQMLDSARQIDTTASNIDLELVLPTSCVIKGDISQVRATVSNGVAVFSGLTFTNCPTTFFIGVSDPTSTARVPLSSGQVAVERNLLTADARQVLQNARAFLARCVEVSDTSCPLTLAFAAEWGPYSSFVFAAEQPFAASVGSTIPTIVVELRDEFGVSTLFPASVAPQLVAYTADDPAAEQLLVTKDGANRGVYQKGRYYFSCLQFASAPAGLVRIQFMPVDESGTPAIRLEGITRGAPLRTGFATVTSVPTPAYGLRFAADVSVIAYAGQASSAVLNVALPAVTVEVTDSRGELDTTDSTTVIVASVSAGQLDATGARERVTRGRATFHGLKFSSMVDEPLLAFRAYQSARALAGRSLSTGRFMLTTLPVAEFNLGFLPQLTAESQVTHAFKSFIFQNLTDAVVRASIVVLDSAHQRATAVTSTIYISPSSEQVNLDSSELKSIDSRSACACANFSNRITGYKDGYQPGTPIYVTYTAVDASGLLRGKTVVAGPIVVGSLLAGATTCAANLVAPVVVAEFRMTVAQFRAANVRSQLAYLMGIELGRVTVQDASLTSITRVDHSTLATWVGSKAAIVFGDPLPASTNQKTSAQLAADFVGLRPRCDTVSVLKLEAAYYQQDDQKCSPDGFRASITTSRQCADQSILNPCQCYNLGVFAAWGFACAEDKAVLSEFLEICKDLADCAEVEIYDVCQTVLANEETSWTWAYIVLGCGLGLIVIVLVLRRTGILRPPQKATLQTAGNHVAMN